MLGIACGLAVAACAPAPSADPVAGIQASPTTLSVPATTLSGMATGDPTNPASISEPSELNPTVVVTTTSVAPPDVASLARSVLMVGIRGQTLREGPTSHLRDGGRAVILVGANIGTKPLVSQLTSDIACAAAAPVLIAVDQELSSRVRRLGSELVTPLPSAREARVMTPAELRVVGELLGAELLDLGINMDLAPVLDVVRGSNPALGGRHLGSDPELVAVLGEAFMTGLESSGVIPVPKHFPGHGLSETDPHDESVVIDASLDELRRVDYLPFEVALADGRGAVMVGHPVYAALDPEQPASLSPAVLNLLRDHFGFEGVAMTDSLSMRGVGEGRSAGELAVAALAAGEDLLLVQTPARIDDSVAAIVAAVARGEVPLERLTEAASRVEALAGSAAQPTCNR